MTNAEIYLDMDGVCVDFLGAAMTAQGYDAKEYFKRWLDEHPGQLFPEEPVSYTHLRAHET